MPNGIRGRGHRIGVGDVIISRRNEPTLGVFDAADINTGSDAVRNRQRATGTSTPSTTTPNTRVSPYGASTTSPRRLQRRDYLPQHITHGYAVTVQSAQGVTADTTPAVLGEHTSRVRPTVDPTHQPQAA